MATGIEHANGDGVLGRYEPARQGLPVAPPHTATLSTSSGQAEDPMSTMCLIPNAVAVTSDGLLRVVSS